MKSWGNAIGFGTFGSYPIPYYFTIISIKCQYENQGGKANLLITCRQLAHGIQGLALWASLSPFKCKNVLRVNTRVKNKAPHGGNLGHKKSTTENKSGGASFLIGAKFSLDP